MGAVNTVIISPDSQNLISGSTDTTIKLWNLNTGELLHTLTGHLTAVLSVSITTDGNTLASSSSDGIIKIWHVKTGRLIQTLNGLIPVAFSPDGKTLLSGGNGGTFKIWHQAQSFDNLTFDTIQSGEWWEVLGVAQDAHPKDVKFAYRRLARLYHPDINPSGSAKASIQAVNRAYQKFQEQLTTEKSSKFQ